MKDVEEKYSIIRDRQMDFVPGMWNPILHTSRMVKDIYGVNFNVAYNILSKGRGQSIFIKREQDSCANHIALQTLNNKSYFKNIRAKTIIAEKAINKFLKRAFKKDYSKVKFSDLIKETQLIQSLFMQYDAASVFSWFIAGDLIREKIYKKIGLSHVDFEIISLPDQKTQATQMDIDVLKAVMSSKNIEKSARELSKKYFWIPYGYDGPDVYDSKHFLEKINESAKEKAKLELGEIKLKEREIKAIKSKIIKQLSKEDKDLVQIIHDITVWTDERKKLEYSMFYYYGQILGEFEKRFGIPFKNLKFLMTEELPGLENNTAKLIKISDKRIGEDFMTITKGGVLKIADTSEFDLLRAELKKQIFLAEIKGSVVSKGSKTKYIAKVKVLQSAKEYRKIEEGEILVTNMTTPDYVPAMRMALGFVTDEGGITCHAAIVAREMNKPCIIGTKNATKILKDGDTVEMDMVSGVVRVIE